MPIVSVVMPVYNAEQYIEEAIRSIENQTMTDWELIIVNEPTSTDATNDIVKKYMDRDARIKLVINETRLGISKSLNVGLKISEGKYIARMDADDISLPSRLREQVYFMENHPDIGISGCDYVVEGESWKSDLLLDDEEIKADLLFFVPLRHPTIIMRKEMLKKYDLMYSQVFSAAEDYDLYVRSKKHLKMANLDKKLLIYRRHENATVYRMIEEGVTVNKILGKGMLEEIGMQVSDEDIDLLYNHGYLHRKAEDFGINKLQRFEGLLEQIWEANQSKKVYKDKALFRVLTKRWEKEISAIKKSMAIMPEQLENIIKNSEFAAELYERLKQQYESSSELAIYMVLDSSMCNVIKAVKSVINQSYPNWNMQIVGEIENNKINQKLNIICNLFPQIAYELVKKTELAGKLKQMCSKSNSEYISIISGNDCLFKCRYEKQISSLIENQKYIASICSVKNGTKILCNDLETYKVNLLFEDAIDSSAVIFRNITDNIFYTGIGEIYTQEYIVNFLEEAKCTIIKDELLEKDRSDVISEYTYSKFLNKYSRKWNISSNERNLLKNAKVEYAQIQNVKQRVKYKKTLRKVFFKICKGNRKTQCFNQELLESRIVAEWSWIIEGRERYTPNENYNFKKYLKASKKSKLHFYNKIIIKFDRFFYNHSRYRHYNELMNQYLQGIREFKEIAKGDAISEDVLKKWTWERFQRTERLFDKYYNEIERKVDQKVWDAERRIIVLDDLAMNLSHVNNRVPYIQGEKVRIVIVFQVASFWPSIAFLYQELMADERFEVIILCYDEPIDTSIKTETARSFLEESSIPFIDWINFSMRDYAPHIVMLQTPYDSNRRKEFKSNYLKMAGYRVVYIPYGMEIGDTPHSRKQQLDHIVRRYAWKIYTFSEAMHRDYRMYSEQEDNVVVTGLPKFDSLYHKELFPLNKIIYDRAEGRRIILWKVHFPKTAKVNGKKELFTPDINEYIEFANYIQMDAENFYIFMPHPRFLEFNEDKGIQKQLTELMDKLKTIENVYIDNTDDYRNSLLNADAIIVDRSSVMVEAAAVGVPILFMSNREFKEPMTQAISPLINSYYQGDTCSDMIAFVQMVNKGADTEKEMREAMFNKCIPYFDGKCSERIRNDIYSSLIKE